MPKGHFSVAMKRAWNWIDETMVAKLGSPTNAFCLADETCTNGGTFMLNPIDNGKYARNKIVGIQIYLAEISKTLWISYRGRHYKGLGALMTWSFEQEAPGGDKTGFIGPEQVIPYIQKSETMPTWEDVMDLEEETQMIPVGATYVWDLDHVGAKIEVLSYKSSSNQLQVKVSFESKTSDELEKTSSLVVEGEYDCGYGKGNAAVKRHSVQLTPGEDKYHLIKLNNEHPAHLDAQVCFADQSDVDLDSPRAGVYVYDQFPLQFELGGDPRIGAIHFENVRNCQDFKKCTLDVKNLGKDFDGEWQVDWTKSGASSTSWFHEYDGYAFRLKPVSSGSDCYYLYRERFGLDKIYYQICMDFGTGGKISVRSVDAFHGESVNANKVSIGCSSDGTRIRLLPKYTNVLSSVSYKSFSRASYVLFYWGNKAGPSVSFDMECETASCRKNGWKNRVKGTCTSCPADAPFSPAGSTSSANCHSGCTSLVITTNKNAVSGTYEIVNGVANDGRPVWFNSAKNMYLYSIWGGAYWQWGPVIGSEDGPLYANPAPHPTLIKKMGVKIECNLDCIERPQKACKGKDATGTCYWNKWTQDCGYEKSAKPSDCTQIKNRMLCTKECVWNKAVGDCARRTSAPTMPVLECAERAKNICTRGRDPSNKRCYFNKFTESCSLSGKRPTDCTQITNKRFCNLKCGWFDDACVEKTKKPTPAPLPCAGREKKQCRFKGVDVNGDVATCRWSKFTNACGTSTKMPENCADITVSRWCKYRCAFDKEANTCAERTAKPTPAPLPCANFKTKQACWKKRARCAWADATCGDK